MQQLSKAKEPALFLWITGIAALLFLGLLAALILLPQQSLFDRLRWLDSGICAQLLTHSFYPGGERLPLCARNTGIYLGFMMALITLSAIRRGRAQQLPGRPITILLASSIVILAIDGLNSFALDLGLPHLYQPHNLLRLATGLLTGLALGAFMLPVLNRLLWNTYNEQRSISSWKGLMVLLSVLLLCFFAIASQNALILYPVALLSTAGLLTVVSSINLVVLVMISRQVETFERYHHLLPFLVLAIMLATGEMLALAQLKLSLLQALAV